MIINFTAEFKFTEDTKKQFNEIKEKELKENKLLIDDQETQT